MKSQETVGRAPQIEPPAVWRAAEMAEILHLLQQVGLPTADLTTTPERARRVFVALGSDRNDAAPRAIGGIEVYGDSALLRSIAVAPEWRRRGLATAVVEQLEQAASQEAVRQIVLLTTDASAFFASCGYLVISRDELPAQLRDAPQVAEVCPQNATVMSKRL